MFEPNPVDRGFFERTGLRKESEWQDETFERFRKTGDVNETSFAGIMKANWRAWAAAEKAIEQREEEKRDVSEVRETIHLQKRNLQLTLSQSYVHTSSNRLFISGFTILPS